MIAVKQRVLTCIGSLWRVILEEDVRGSLFALVLKLLLEAIERPDAYLLVITCGDEYCVCAQCMVPCEADSSSKSLMGVDLEDGLPFWQVPEDDLTVCTPSDHVCQVSSALGHYCHSV